MFESDRDDLLQEGRLAILHAADTFDETRGSKLSTYTYIVVRNALLRAAKKLSLYSNYYNSLPYEEELSITKPDCEEEIMYDELKQHIDNHRHKTILGAYFIDQRTQEDISINLGYSQQWVSQVINSFRKEVSELWKI